MDEFIHTYIYKYICHIHIKTEKHPPTHTFYLIHFSDVKKQLTIVISYIYNRIYIDQISLEKI